MVYPVSNPLVQQQVPAANTFQPGGTEATKKPEENKAADSTRPQGSDTARSEALSNRDTEDRAQRAAANDRAQDTGAVYSSASRGTQLDITA